MMSALSTETMEQRFARLQRDIRAYSKKIGNPLAEDYDPILELAKLAVNPGTPADLRVRCHSEVAAYRYPKLKSMEIALPAGSEGKITIEITHFGGKHAKNNKADVEPDYTRLPTQ